MERIYSAQQTKTIRSTGFIKKRRGFPYGWAATAAVVFLLILFSIGAFGVNPTVIISGSMQPTINVGDIALVKDVSPESIEENDIIKFKEGNGTPILHRVINISEENGTRVFQTKGDDNDEPDRALVYPDQVEGKVVLTIPKLGWISIGIKEMLAQ